jgi:hypothetical protein
VQRFVSVNQFIAEAESWMAQKDPEKKMPSTVVNAIVRLAKLAVVVSHHLRAQCAFRWTQGTVSIARRKCIFLLGSLMYMSINSEYISLWMFLTVI